jgi:hypothetical protein
VQASAEDSVRPAHSGAEQAHRGGLVQGMVLLLLVMLPALSVLELLLSFSCMLMMLLSAVFNYCVF